MKCTRCQQLVGAELANPAIARATNRDGTVWFICTPHLDGWLDYADDHPADEPAEVAFLVTTAFNTTVEDELALVIGSMTLAGYTPLAIARGLLTSGWTPPPVEGIAGMALHRG
ncbi:hypothetical protein GCM10027258_62780 [Amycolatopsis stemonae]